MTATGTFKDLEGNSYSVVFSGDSITEAKTLTLAASPVSISFSQGEHKYDGFRSVQAVVRIVTSEALDFLYSESLRAISCTISKGADILFYGCVEPEAYDQPFLLCNDEIEITCIDAISALKETYYTHAGAAELLAPIEYIKEICDKAGVSKIIIQANIISGQNLYWPITTTDYCIASQAFRPERETDKANYPLTKVLSSICQFFGYNAICWGGILYLYDPKVIESGDSARKKVYTKNGSIWIDSIQQLTSAITVTAEMFRGTDNRYSIEPAYQKIEITPDKQKLVFVADALEDCKNDRFISGEQTFTIRDQGEFRYKASTLEYDGLECKHVNQGGETTNVTSDELSGETDWFGAIPIRAEFTPPLGVELDFVGFRFILPKDIDKPDAKNYIWIRNRHVDTQYNDVLAIRIKDSHKRYMDGRPFRIAMNVMYKSNQDSHPTVPPLYEEGTSATFLQNWITLKCGNKYYKWDKAADARPPVHTKWETGWNTGGVGTNESPLALEADGQSTKGGSGLVRSAYAWEHYLKGFVDQGIEGVLDFVLPLSPYPTAGAEGDWWISDISVEVYDEDEDKYDSQLMYEAAGETEKIMSVDAGLVAKIKDYQRVVDVRPEATWPAAYMGGSATVSASGLLLTHLMRYTEKHKCYKLQLDEQAEPWSKMSFLGEDYTVDAMEWDVQNGIKTITIN